MQRQHFPIDKLPVRQNVQRLHKSLVTSVSKCTVQLHKLVKSHAVLSWQVLERQYTRT